MNVVLCATMDLGMKESAVVPASSPAEVGEVSWLMQLGDIFPHLASPRAPGRERSLVKTALEAMTEHGE